MCPWKYLYPPLCHLLAYLGNFSLPCHYLLPTIERRSTLQLIKIMYVRGSKLIAFQESQLPPDSLRQMRSTSMRTCQNSWDKSVPEVSERLRSSQTTMTSAAFYRSLSRYFSPALALWLGSPDEIQLCLLSTEPQGTDSHPKKAGHREVSS